MAKDHTKRHVKIETELGATSKAETAHERMNARPDKKELGDPKEVWKNAETTPAADRAAEARDSGMAGRVADAGDVGAGQASPYGTEAQADALARQTNRSGEPRGVEKPKRG